MNVVGVNHREFLRDYSQAVEDGAAAMFIGAGVSRGAGYVDWKSLLKQIADDLGLDVDKETDLVALAQFHLNDRGGKDRLNQLLIDEFVEQLDVTPAHRLIATLPIDTFWTTNYDDLIERALEQAEKRVDVKRRPTDFGTTRKRTDATVYKMHGDKTDAADAILTKEDYDTYNPKRELFTIALKGDLTMRTFCFLGVSFNDPNLMYLLSRVRQLIDVNSRQHYCVMRRPRPEDYPGAEYDCKRFPYWVRDLTRYKIQPVLIDSYQEIEVLLSELNRRCHLRDVFISGSAADYSPMGEPTLRRLCQCLGEELIKNGFNLISGFGQGIGGDVITGAMRPLRRNDDDRLKLRPFPQDIASPEERAKFWTEYRDRMLADAGICIVVAGNKLENGAIVPAAGVEQEIAIARGLGRIILPIGATGHAARRLWDQFQADGVLPFATATIAPLFEVLGDVAATPEKIVKATIDILKVFNR